MSNTHNISDSELGRRLRIARTERQMTQAEAAQRLGVARTTLVAIEKGARQVATHELLHLADAYNVRVNSILRESAVHVNLIPRFRQFARPDESSDVDAVETLNWLVSAEVELEALLGVSKMSRLPKEIPIEKGDVRQQARRDAYQIRDSYGLGSRPIVDLFQFLDVDLGIRLYFHPLASTVSGLFAYDDAVGACILINALHPYYRQVATGSHEFAHIVSARHRPDICSAAYHVSSREERYAAAFASEFLMPKDAIADRLRDVTLGSDKLTRRHVILLAHYFGVSREAVVRHLEDHRLAPDGTWEWFLKNGGISNAQAAEVLGDRDIENRQRRMRPLESMKRIRSLAVRAFQRNLMTEGQVSELLRISRIDARRLRLQAEEFADDAAKLA